MLESPITRPSLLLRIRDRANHEAWEQFVSLYGPLVYQFARKRGLQDADAADLTQTVFTAVSQEIQRLDYDTERGTFRSWLFAVTRNHLAKYFRSTRHHDGSRASQMDQLLAEQPAPDHDEQLWLQEYRRRMFLLASERIQGEFETSSWQAFWLTAVEGRSAQEVGRALAMSVGAIYTAKSRVLARLRVIVAELDANALFD